MDYVEKETQFAEFRLKYAPISEGMRMSRDSKERIRASLRAEAQIHLQAKRWQPWRRAGVSMGVVASMAIVMLGGLQILREPSLPSSPTRTADIPTFQNLDTATGPNRPESMTKQVLTQPSWAASSVPLANQMIQMVTAKVGWQAEVSGSVLRTINGGVSWTNVTPLMSAKQQGPFQTTALNAQIAWEAAVTHSPNGEYVTVYHTLNGGKSWSHSALIGTVTVNARTQTPLSLTFLDEQHGWLSTQVVDSRTGKTLAINLYHTKDGGRTWHLLSSGAPLKLDFKWLTFINQQLGFTVTSQQLPGSSVVSTPPTWQFYRTTDGGKTWLPLALKITAFAKIRALQPTFFANGAGILPVESRDAGNQHQLDLFFTPDFGKTWTKEYTAVGTSGNVVTNFLSPETGVVTWNGMLRATQDGWHTVQMHVLPDPSAGVSWLNFSSATHGTVTMLVSNPQRVAANLSYETLNAGQQWSQVMAKP